MKINQVAAQLYTVRSQMKSVEDVAGTLKKVKAIGYQAVEVCSLPPMPDEDVGKMLADSGLVPCSSHESTQMILEQPAKIAERVREFGGKATACPSPGGTKLDSLEDVLRFAKLLNQAGRIMRENGVALAYHNHSGEFRCFGRGTMLEILYEETDPANLKGQPDTYWVQYGGGDPVEWCERLKGRLGSLHMKDYMITEKHEPVYCEIGRGNLSWKRIVAAAEASGCPWFIVEQDRCEGDPFDSLRISFEYIRDHLCS